MVRRRQVAQGFQSAAVEPDLQWAFIQGSYAKAHQHSAGAASGNDKAIGESRAGNISKIHLAVDAYGLPTKFEIAGGQFMTALRPTA